uniref:Uncharacterized protein n=1 Tax=Chelonoidis abingdonii TaxID=106734 RepID=A0A8C0ILU7_CHEAB
PPLTAGRPLCHTTPLQQWGEEVEDGAIYSVTLHRVRAGGPFWGPSGGEEAGVGPPCPFVQYRTCKLRRLRAGTLPQLVRGLVAASAESDPGYLPSFLATYRAFATPGGCCGLGGLRPAPGVTGMPPRPKGEGPQSLICPLLPGLTPPPCPQGCAAGFPGAPPAPQPAPAPRLPAPGSPGLGGVCVGRRATAELSGGAGR